MGAAQEPAGLQPPAEVTHAVAARSRLRRLAAPTGLAALGTIVLVLVLAQLLLPGIAAESVQEEVGKYGRVQSTHVSATPAVELLWGHAQHIEVKAAALHMTAANLASLANKLSGVEEADLRATQLLMAFSAPVQGSVTLHEAHLGKRAGVLSVSGRISPADVSAALPLGLAVGGIQASGGRLIVSVEGTFVAAHVQAQGQVLASEGKIVIEPQGLPFASLARIVIFEDPRLDVLSVNATPEGSMTGIAITARASG